MQTIVFQRQSLGRNHNTVGQLRGNLVQQRIEYRNILATYEQRFGNDLKRLDKLEESDKMTKRALLALIRHAESGNNTDELKNVAKELNDYVWG